MSFITAGDINCKIDKVEFAEPKFAKGPNDFDVCIHGTSIVDPNQGGWWRGEMSQNYGRGIKSSQTQMQITGETLVALGFSGGDLWKLEEMILNKETSFHVEATESTKDGSTRTFYNVKWIGGGNGDTPDVITSDVMKNKLAALVSEIPAVPAATVAAQMPTATSTSTPPVDDDDNLPF